MSDDHTPSEKELEEAIIYYKKKALLNELRQFEETLPTVNLAKPWYRQKWWLRLWLIALVTGILLSLIWLFRGEQPKQTLNPTIVAYFRHNPSFSSGLRSPDAALNLEDQAFAFYNDENYQEAIPLFEALFSEQQDTSALFWLGIAQLGTGDAREAYRTLERFRNFQPGNQSEKVHFYLMLAYLQENQSEKVREEAAQLQSAELKSIAEEVLEQLPTPN